jgi:type IV fimbrial biogenesis protein FimT
MRLVMNPSSRGFTLIELIVVVAIVAGLIAASVPTLNEYNTNSRLREGGNALLADALYAQSEALKRNTTVTLEVTDSALRVFSPLVPDVNLRQRGLPPGLHASVIDITFNGTGRPTPFGTAAQVDVAMDDVVCSDQRRCPRLLVDTGGGVRLCGNKLDCN